MAEVLNHANRIPYQQQGREAIVDGSEDEYQQQDEQDTGEQCHWWERAPTSGHCEDCNKEERFTCGHCGCRKRAQSTSLKTALDNV
uniref:WGS project CBMI000000000 data, contig CS3069_c002561 n=1 Tax=Fusarium clavum TaxID=2594811 RepID=A0A090MH41_9HYPO|nr:unnamed protein product [Fusarium clavum]